MTMGMEWEEDTEEIPEIVREPEPTMVGEDTVSWAHIGLAALFLLIMLVMAVHLGRPVISVCG